LRNDPAQRFAADAFARRSGCGGEVLMATEDIRQTDETLAWLPMALAMR
jgi:hypothetical protein